MPADIPNNNSNISLFLSGGGEMGELVRSYNWQDTPLGPPSTWPQSLLTTLNIVLNSKFPMFIFWGPDHICFYNDSYRPSLGNSGKHPALGKKGAHVWPEIWDFIKPLIDAALAGEEASWHEDQLLPIYRNGRIEDVYWTFSYSPILAENGAIGGVLVICNETTPTVTAFRQIKEKEDQLRFAVDATELGTWEFDLANNTILLNDRLRSWYGFREAETPTIENIFELIAEEDREIVQDVWNNAIDFNNPADYRIDYAIRPVNGHPQRIVRARGKAVFDSSGRTIRVRGTLQDVTEQVTAQRQVENSEKYFRKLTDTVPSIIWMSDPEGKYTYMNQNWYEYTGQETVQAYGFGWKNALHEDDIKRAMAVKNAAHRQQKRYNVTYRLRTYQGDYRWTLEKASPKFSVDGIFEGMIGTVVDIHEQKQAEEEIRIKENMLHLMIEESPIRMTYLTGPDLRISMVNATVLKSWGRDYSIIGQPLAQVLPEMKSQPYIDALHEVYRTGKSYSVKESFVQFSNNGKIENFYFDIWYKPITNIDGTINGILTTAMDVTEKVNTQKMISESEYRFRSLIEESPIPTSFFAGEDMIIEVANEQMIQLWGKDDSVIGKPLLDALPEIRNQSFPQILADIFKTGQTYAAKDAFGQLMVDGVLKTFYFDYTYKPVFNADGDVIGIIDTAVDVTQKVLAQKHIEESERNLRNTILQAPVAMCILRYRNHVVEIANDRMFELWGVSSDNVGKDIFSFLPDLRAQGFGDLLDHVYQTGETYKAFGVPVDLPRNGKTETIYCDFVYEAFRESDGSISGILVVATEVTDQFISRKKAEEAEEKARLAIDSAELGAYDMDFETEEVHTSARFKEIWGINDDAPRSEYTQRIHPDDRQKRIDAHKKSLTTGNLDYEARVVWPDHSVHWVRVKGKVLYDKDGNPKSLLGVIQEITEQKEFAEQLTRLVNERTLQLSRSNDELLQFAHVASHDLKEPVRKIKIYSNMLQNEFGSLLPEKGMNYLTKVQHATNRMFSMIEGVLTYSSLNAVNQAIDHVSLNDIFSDIEQDLEIMIQQKQAVIQRGVLPDIEGASVLLFQLFYNLINNSLKFSRADTQCVIDISHELLENNMLYIRVSDNGIGFDPEYINKIFDAFIRLNAKDAYEGTGLGLALCKRIVERHHGTIEASGEPGKGATFIITLPLTQSSSLV